MTSREEFEKCEVAGKHDFHREADGNYACRETRIAFESWQARQPEIDVLRQERDELAAQVEVMRKALKTCDSDWADGCYGTLSVKTYDSEKVELALSVTPSSALREIQARVLEAAAARLDLLDYKTLVESGGYQGIFRELAVAIRKGE